MNQVIQVITLGADPEIRQSANGKTMAKFSGAVPKRYTREGEDNVNWFQYVAFGATADFIEKYFFKGSKMLIVGEVNNNNYTKEDGTKVYGVQILVNSVEFYGKKSDSNVPNNSTPTDTAPAEPQKSTPAAAAPDSPAAPANSEPATASYDAYDDF